MANAAEHNFFGMVTGALTCTVTSNPRTLKELAASLCVGGVSGAIGAKLPDLIEPATHPRHRGHFHSVAAGVGVGVDIKRIASSADPNETFPERLARGAVGATGAGYISHLVLDATTPARLPLL
jgi:inner membrane protein